MLKHLIKHDPVEPCILDWNLGKVAHVGRLGIRLVDHLEIGALILAVTKEGPIRLLTRPGIEDEGLVSAPKASL